MSDVLSRLLREEDLLSDEDANAFASAHQLSEPCHDDVVDSQLERQVSQWLGGLFVCWEEHWLEESGQRAIRLVAPEARWLSRIEAARLLCASRTQGQVEALSELSWEGTKVA
jgi:hypothetical protein